MLLCITLRREQQPSVNFNFKNRLQLLFSGLEKMVTPKNCVLYLPFKIDLPATLLKQQTTTKARLLFQCFSAAK
jgi:hypothetical protein